MKEFDKGANLDQSSRVQCVVDFFGPTEMLTMGPLANKPDGVVAKLIGGPVQDNKEKARAASPLTYVSKDSAPFLIMHGDRGQPGAAGAEREAGGGAEEGGRGGHARGAQGQRRTAARHS